VAAANRGRPGIGAIFRQGEMISMSDRNDGRQRGDKLTRSRPATANSRSGPRSRSPVREARREAVRKAAAERAAAVRRKRLIIGGIAAVVVIGLVVVVAAMWPDAKPKAKATPQSTAQSAALKTKPVVGAGTGELTKLAVTTLIEGTGATVKAGQNLSVNYVGVTYKDGKEFESSWSNSQPLSLVIGQGQVIKGWDQGLVGVKVGSRVQLDIPSDLAYGDNPRQGTPGGPLRFVVDVLSAT
jgi:peptidylprolyl isomerase